MMSGSVVLERFEPSDHSDDATKFPDMNRSGMVQPAHKSPADLLAEEAADLHREEANAAKKCIAALNKVVEQAKIDLETKLDSAVQKLSQTFWYSAQESMPSVIDAAQALETGLICTDILRSIKAPRLKLVASTHLHECFVEALSKLKLEPEIEIIADDGLAPGETRILWSDGGATLDVAEMKTRIQARLEELMNHAMQEAAYHGDRP